VGSSEFGNEMKAGILVDELIDYQLLKSMLSGISTVSSQDSPTVKANECVMDMLDLAGVAPDDSA
jgi:hypothetical protein